MPQTPAGDYEFDVAIIGGGFFGAMLALDQRAGRFVVPPSGGRGSPELAPRVLLLEARPELLKRASYNNQARVHNGYHYPRSLVTAARSRVNFPRFVKDFEDCIQSDFEKYYAVASKLSKVTARQFQTLYESIGAPISPAPQRVVRLFDPDLIDGVFAVREFVFDADKICRRLVRELEEAGVEVWLNSTATRVQADARGGLHVSVESDRAEQISAATVYNCTYAHLNHVLAGSGLPQFEVKQELAEMCLVEVPDELANLGITVMCGPFFSLMPFPPRGLHTLSHVRYTPHEAWPEGRGPWQSSYERLAQSAKKTNFPYMLKDSARYLPLLAECRYRDSLWEIKTVLPRSEKDDSRPILFKRDHGLPNFHCVLGAKIDNIYDLLDEIHAGQTTERRAA